MKLDPWTVVILSVDIVFLEMINTNTISKLFSLIMYILTIVYFKYYYNEKYVVAIIKFVISVALVAVLQMGVAVVVYAVNSTDVPEDISVFIINSVVAMMVVIGTSLGDRNRRASMTSWIVKQKMPVAYIVVWLATAIIIFKLYGRFQMMQAVIVFSCASIISVVISAWQKDHGVLVKEKEEIVRENEYREEFGNMIGEIRRKQHDFDNHLNAIAGMHLTVDNMEELAKKLEEYKKNIAANNKYNKIAGVNSSPVIVGFLYNKLTQIENSGTDVEFKIVIEEAITKLSQMNLVEILGILLDNATEAVENRDKTQRKIYLSVVETDSKLCIEVSNPCDEMLNSSIDKLFCKGYSTKGEQRGLGLYNVKTIVEKNGTISVENIKRQNEKGMDCYMFFIKVEIDK